jgi:hypothetical protein
MANAEKLLHEAQYAFNSISFGESRANSRNRRRAGSLSRKIIRRYPDSIEAQEAHAILRRLGEEAYVPRLSAVHRHPEPVAANDVSAIAPVAPTRERPQPASVNDDSVPLDWNGLVSVLLKLPKVAWGVIGFIAFVLFGLFGFFLLVPLLGILLFTGPFRGLLQPKQRETMNRVIIMANTWIDERLRSV